MKDITSEICRIAKREVGVVESPKDSNCGVRVNEYKAATGLNPKRGWPWCAAFVCWVLREALKSAGAKSKTPGFSRPRTAGAYDMENWSRDQDSTTWTRSPHYNDIKPGDIVIFTFSHIGFAVSSPDSSGFVQTVEGNTNEAGSREGGGVFAKRRHVSKIRSRIRLIQNNLVPA